MRWFCPDVMNGSVAYTPEELGAETDQDGNVINVERAEVIEAEVIQEETHEEGDRPFSIPLTLEEACSVYEFEGDCLR